MKQNTSDDESPWLAGRMLLALPAIADTRFDHAAIIMIVHSTRGAMGIALTATTKMMNVGDVMDQLEIEHDQPFEQPLLLGGPVEPRRGFVLHSRDWSISDSLDISGRWMLTSSHEILRAIAKGQGPKNWRVVLGYAGWGQGQLEKELTGHSWHVVAAEDEILFDTAPEDRWRSAFERAGIDVRWLSMSGGTA